MKKQGLQFAAFVVRCEKWHENVLYVWLRVAVTVPSDRSLMDKTMASDAVVAGSSPVGRISHDAYGARYGRDRAGWLLDF